MITITMLRFFSARDLCSVFKLSLPTASSLARRRVKPFSLPQCYVCAQKVNFFTKSPCRKDAPLPNPRVSDEPETSIDLDKWKTVMRSKETQEEKIEMGDEDDDGEEEEFEGDLTLKSTRELVSMWRLAGKLVPQEISDEELQTLAELTTKSARKKYLKYLAIREGHKKSRKEKQQRKKAAREQSAEAEGDEGDAQKEPELKSSLILQFWNRSLDKLLAWRSAQAMLFGQPLIFDFSYEGIMSKREVENTVSQLMEVEAWNRRATDPYHLHFCNLQPDSYYKQQLLKRYGEEIWDRLFITSTNKQHCEVFPREKLVYLTADSPNVLRTYDHNKVYIVGALVDRSIQKGVSLAQAKRLKLATARLPLDEFLHWEMGAKNLTLDQLIRILLTMKEKGKWQEALQFVPTRKHDGFHSHQWKGTTSVQNNSQKTFKSVNLSEKTTLNRPKTVKAKTGKSKQANKRNWWDE